MDKTHAALAKAVGDYKASYAKDPRFRRVLASLDGVLSESKRLHPEASESPGARSAREAGLNRPRQEDEQVRQSAPEAPQGADATGSDKLPTDWSGARQMAAERFSRAS